ncbi:cellulose synthase/poly-beta-1,6-N-acetylglucosamine synthase-like glycosyltransferase [Lactobacillus colini]|uniref:Cellulose synthase/poly-beta-1,6-N-acetylglucosamine synthase-like glycosyltransferase n=1 Tax=Lactobacillus colini TaxID=1819254 RepID=A0ABS4MFE3_9LACO|nr:glycosyltransferase [Lactobacillus colini]MBP2058333.1 cellulose synthase/poly-beta-1,6-N-acetylglucosamine synthase-like glycosyltransferase [Lactobacillus colini]
MSEILQILTLISIWASLLMSMITLGGAVYFWLRHSKVSVKIKPLARYPRITLVVPAHNEEVVIQKTTLAILNLNYPPEKLEILIFADNCQDHTAEYVRSIIKQDRYQGRNIRVIDRTGGGGKAGVLNDALKMAHGEYIGVYDADAMPEENALYFLVKKILENPDRYMASFGRNKTRNAKQGFLTKCINQEIVVTQRIQHCGIWQLFKIGRIPGTNFIIKTDYVKSIGGWRNGALTEDTDISFKIMGSGKLIALAYNSEAFQQEPETLKDYYFQRLRWAKGNYEVVINNFKQLFNKTNWRVKLETFYYAATFFWFNASIVLSDIFFITNICAWIINLWNPAITIPFTIDSSNLLIAQILLFNWFLMIMLYILQILTALATQYGQATNEQIWLALASYFTYSQLFIVISIHAVISVTMDRLFKRDNTKWVKTKRFAD